MSLSLLALCGSMLFAVMGNAQMTRREMLGIWLPNSNPGQVLQAPASLGWGTS